MAHLSVRVGIGSHPSYRTQSGADAGSRYGTGPSADRGTAWETPRTRRWNFPAPATSYVQDLKQAFNPLVASNYVFLVGT